MYLYLVSPSFLVGSQRYDGRDDNGGDDDLQRNYPGYKYLVCTKSKGGRQVHMSDCLFAHLNAGDRSKCGVDQPVRVSFGVNLKIMLMSYHIYYDVNILDGLITLARR